MDYTRAVNVCWRKLPKESTNWVTRAEVEGLCHAGGVAKETLDRVWAAVGQSGQADILDYPTFAMVLGFVSLAQRGRSLDARAITPELPPPEFVGVTDGQADPTTRLARFVMNPNPWSTWTMALDWQPPPYEPKPVIVAPVDIEGLPDDPTPRIDYSKWHWDPRILRPSEAGEAANENDPPEFPEPDFPPTGIAEVDDQIRKGILDRLREEWELERLDREVAQGKKHERNVAAARSKREEAVNLVSSEAAMALNDPNLLSKIMRLNAVISAARRLETFLEPELSLTEDTQRWDTELCILEASHFGEPSDNRHNQQNMTDRNRVVDMSLTGDDNETTGPSACTKCAGEVAPSDKFCPNCGNPVETLHVPVQTDDWEIDRSRIVELVTIGEGEFGEVKKGILDGSRDVAIKTAKKQVRAFLGEAGKMKKLKNRNIVELLGVCTVGEPALIVLEFARSGCVLDFLHKNYKRIQVAHQCSMCADVAAGLAYLLKTHWIHGDLAARNLLVGGDMKTDNVVVKICDFGHAMQTDEFNTPILVSRQLAFRWTAPELYEFRRSSPETDVWSFGVVVFEILSSGRVPYADIDNNKEVMKKIQSGWRMPREKYVWKQFYEMMIACWHKDPSKRPKPQTLCDCCRRWQNAPNLGISKGGSLQYQGGLLKFEY